MENRHATAATHGPRARARPSRTGRVDGARSRACVAFLLSCSVVTHAACEAMGPDDAPVTKDGADAASDAAGDGDADDAAPVHEDAGDGASEYADFEPGEENPGGTVTTTVTDDRAFYQPLTGLSAAARTTYFAGQALFEMSWIVSANPSGSTSDRVGLGPTFNAVACQACHAKNGRGAPPLVDGAPLVSALLRVSVEGTSSVGGPMPHPIYGDQVQPTGIAGVPGEGTVSVTYATKSGAYVDGTAYELLEPRVVFAPNLGDPGPGLRTSMRGASMTIGMGLLEAIPEPDLLAHADPDDDDGDGISGRPNRVWNVETSSRTLGRFGWKANQPTVTQQNAAAFLGDIGVTTPLFPEDNCPNAQTACIEARDKDGANGVEVSRARLDALDVFVRATSVPRRRDATSLAVLRGKRLFANAGCARCHVPKARTGEVGDLPELSGQTIWPYTDLLLHDMGEGLADGRPDFDADGREWRTPPLWGLGWLTTVSGHERLLHDGRARGFAEAILWHDGEARASADAFRAMPAADREALVTFLRSL